MSIERFSECGNFGLDPIGNNKYRLIVVTDNFLCEGTIIAQFRHNLVSAEGKNGFTNIQCDSKDGLLTLTFIKCSQKPVMLPKNIDIGEITV